MTDQHHRERLVTSLATPTERAKVQVLYVGGAGRSGSTLLDRSLGQMPGHWSVGELAFLWRASLARDWPCGCGQPFSRCEFWTEVGRVAFGGWGNLDAQEMIALQFAVDRYQHIPQLVAPGVVPGFEQRLEKYAGILAALYSAVQQVSGAAVVVDSSKAPATSLLLRRIPTLDVRLVHLVRDPRGVVYSWGKRGMKNQPGTSSATTGDMSTWTPRHAVRHWWTTNLAFELSGRLGLPKLLLRYEDFVENPRRELHRVADLLGATLADDALDFIAGDSIELEVNHTAAGNPSRFRSGRVPLRADETWRSEMSPQQRRWVTASTRPLARYYGYAA